MVHGLCKKRQQLVIVETSKSQLVIVETSKWQLITVETSKSQFITVETSKLQLVAVGHRTAVKERALSCLAACSRGLVLGGHVTSAV